MNGQDRGEDGGPRGMVQARLALMVTESGVGVGSGNPVNYSREEMGLGRGTAGRGVCPCWGCLWRHWVGLWRWDS